MNGMNGSKGVHGVSSVVRVPPLSLSLPPFLCCLCLSNTLPPPYFDTFYTKADHDHDHRDDSQVSKCKEDLDHHIVFSAERLIRYEDQLLSHAI